MQKGINLIIYISIHALREESDLRPVCDFPSIHNISIHALREESDTLPAKMVLLFVNFNPRSPRGERLYGGHSYWSDKDISIHALREESDFYGFV